MRCHPDSETGERREITPNSLRSLTLFVFSGEERLIDDLQSRIQLREHDALERYGRDELHGLLTHLREIDPSEVEKMFQGIHGERGIFETQMSALFCSFPQGS